MGNIAIKVEGLSKAYQLGEIGTGTISRDVERWFAKVRGKEDPFLRIGETNDRTRKGTSGMVWSLKDLSFEIEQGDAVGIIGRNGAGKSTLLKIISRITAPTTGRIRGNGRIASLLEVGTGFHPELTGSENIFLNGAILGMRKREIQRKFDEIVDFAGVERYVDTPVKRYSSGMYVRLAFAVAAHLESEILIVDEVLAVGDAEFQQKCLGKMGEVSKGEGKTVLFVSHNMASIRNLCNKGLLLQHGLLTGAGPIDTIVRTYREQAPDRLFTHKQVGVADLTKHPGKIDPEIGLTRLEVFDNRQPSDTLHSGSTVVFRLSYNLKEPLIDGEIGFVILDENKEPLIGLNNKHTGHKIFFKRTNPLSGSVDIIFQSFPLYGIGKFSINLYFGYIGSAYEALENAYVFALNPADVYRTGKMLDPNFNKLYYENIVFKHA